MSRSHRFPSPGTGHSYATFGRKASVVLGIADATIPRQPCAEVASFTVVNERGPIRENSNSWSRSLRHRSIGPLTPVISSTTIKKIDEMKGGGAEQVRSPRASPTTRFEPSTVSSRHAGAVVAMLRFRSRLTLARFAAHDENHFTLEIVTHAMPFAHAACSGEIPMDLLRRDIRPCSRMGARVSRTDIDNVQAVIVPGLVHSQRTY